MSKKRETSLLERLYISEAVGSADLEKEGYSSLAGKAHKATLAASDASHLAHRHTFEAHSVSPEAHKVGGGKELSSKHPRAGIVHENAFQENRGAQAAHVFASKVAPTSHQKAYHDKMMNFHQGQMKHHDIMAAHHDVVT